MPAYRFHALPRTDEHPEERQFFNDAAAMAWALRTAGPEGVEIWEDARFVGRLHGAVPETPAQPALDYA